MASYVHLTGFMEDSIFRKNLPIIIGGNDDQGIGVLNSLLIDYFVKIVRINDSRLSRPAILATSTPATGICSIVTDDETIEDPNLWTTISEDRLNAIFNIAEFCYLTQNSDSEYIEHMLTFDAAYNTYYVPNSVMISTVENPVTISNPVNITISVPNWVEFQIYLTADKEKILKVKLWLSSLDFSRNYPYTFITQIVPPCPPETLFNTVKNMSQMETMIESSQFAFSRFNTDLINNDQAGALSFNTRYHLSADTEYTITFAVLYKGAKVPTTMACRAAIKQYLISTGLTTIDNLEILFPELFVDYQFFIIPLWDHKKVLEDRTLYPSISPTYTYIKDEVNRLYPNLNEDYFDTRMQIILNSENDMFSLIIPNSLNPDMASLLDLHPTFNRRASTEVAYSYMEAKTKLLADKLSRVFAVLNREITTGEFNTYVEDGRSYLTFTVGNAELQVMTPEGYHYTPEEF